ncbi:ADP-ribosylglycohydrolase family protein [Streptomyces sp. NPDC055078]
MSAAATGVWGRAEQQDFRARVRGALLGGAVGDALGAGVAALTLEEIRTAHGPDGVTDLVPAHGRRGAVTAATQLTLFTVDGLIRAQVRRDTGAWHPPTDVHRAYLRWAATQRDWGPDERRKDNGWLAREEWLYTRRDPPKASVFGLGDEILGTLECPKNPTARDGGALVRSAPFGLLVGWEPQLVCQLAVECAAQTHGHPTAYLSAGAFAVIVHGLARGETLDGSVQRALALLASRPGHQPVTDGLKRALGAVRQGVPSAERVAAIGGGYQAGNLQAGNLQAGNPPTGNPQAGNPQAGTHPGGDHPAGDHPAGGGQVTGHHTMGAHATSVAQATSHHTTGHPATSTHAEDALAVAVYCALVGEDIRHGLRLAVNHDGPSETTGVVTGALLGALHGETALPPAWLSELEGRPTILELADDFAMEMTQGPALHGPSAAAPGWLARYPRG